MAKFKIQANADIELLTRDEVRDVLRGWMEEIHRGLRFQEFSVTATVAGAGTWQVAAPGPHDTLGPAPGMVWAITRVAVSGPGFARATNDFSVYKDEISPSKLVITVPGVATSTASWEWDVGGLILVGGRRLAFAGAGTAGQQVTVAGEAVEVPVQLAWQLIS